MKRYYYSVINRKNGEVVDEGTTVAESVWEAVADSYDSGFFNPSSYYVVIDKEVGFKWKMIASDDINHTYYIEDNTELYRAISRLCRQGVDIISIERVNY